MDDFDRILEDIKKREVNKGIEIINLQQKCNDLTNALRDCINELCCYCPRIQREHLGACDGCRWKNVKEGWQ
jgi:hypothetical protein